MARPFAYYSPARIRERLAAAGVAPRKRWGQSFLIDGAAARRMAERIAAWQTKRILEIGPGLGALSYPLLDCGLELLAVELDPALCAILSEEFSDSAFRLRHEDARESLAEFAAGRELQFNDIGSCPPPSAVAGNLPYYITTDLLLACADIVAFQAGGFLVQREFAARICGGGADSSLAVYLANHGLWESCFDLRPEQFFPRPQVSSTFIEFRRHAEGPICDPAALQYVLRRAFSSRRKVLANALAQGERHRIAPAELLVLAEAAGVDLRRRAEETAPERFFALASSLAERWKTES